MRLLEEATRQDCALAAAAHVSRCALQAVHERGRFSLALSGGSTPWLMLNQLALLDLPWNRFHVFQVDERVAPEGDPERNLTHIQAQFTDRVAIPKDQVHAMPVYCENLDEGANAYAQTLCSTTGNPPVLDLVHLGLGADGHTASLLPGDPVLRVIDRDVGIARIGNPRIRMTLTFPIIDRARNILWLIHGAEKSNMLHRLTSRDQDIPAGRVKQENAIIITDISNTQTGRTAR